MKARRLKLLAIGGNPHELTALEAERTRELERQLAASQQAERTLRESEALIRAVLDNLPVGIAVNSVDPAVSFIYMNDSFTRLYRTTRERLAHPDAFWETVYEDPEFREVIRRRVLEDCASGDAERMHWEDVPLARRGEETTFISARNTPIPGKPLMMSAVWDVTERWRTEEALRSANRALRQSADEYRELFEAESDAIFLIDNESGRLLQANHAACALYGYSREELLSMRNVDLSAEPEHTRDVTRHTPPVASHVVSIPLRRHRRKDGTILPVEITGRFFVRDGRSVHIAAIRDITERERAEARMAEQLNELRRWHDATLGREGRILELKREVNALLANAGQPPRYPSASDEPLTDG